MKLLILISLILFSTNLFGQKKLMSETRHLLNENGQVTNFDSSAYHYGSWFGSIDKYTHEFGIDQYGLYRFIKSSPRIGADSLEGFANNGGSLDKIFVLKNNLSNDQILSSEFKTLSTLQSQFKTYVYNSQGLLKTEVTDYFNGGTWNSTDSSSFNYDIWDNRINFTTYNPVSGNIWSTDTIEFLPGTHQVTRMVKYFNFTGTATTLIKTLESFAVYSGNQLQYMDLWDYDSGTFEWRNRTQYLYNSSDLEEIKVYFVTSGVVETNPTLRRLISYHPNGEPAVFQHFQDNGITRIDSLHYDSENFITKYNSYGNGTGGGMYMFQTENFYYQNTLGFSDKEMANVSVFPNPCTDYVQIQTSENLKNVEVYNTAGQILIRQNMPTIDVSHLESGVYILKGKTEKGYFSKKIIKE